MLRQVASDYKFPSGAWRVIAVLALKPDAISQRSGIRFEEGIIDSLGSSLHAIVELARSGHVLLIRHVEPDVFGTVVAIDMLGNGVETVNELSSLLHLSEAEIVSSILPEEDQASRDKWIKYHGH